MPMMSICYLLVLVEDSVHRLGTLRCNLSERLK